MKIQFSNISQQVDWNAGMRFINQNFDKLTQVFQNNISIKDNFDGQLLSGITFSAANTEVAIGHSLGRTPIGFIPTLPSAAMSIYNGTTAWTKSNIYLKSSAIGNSSLLLF